MGAGAGGVEVAGTIALVALGPALSVGVRAWRGSPSRRSPLSALGVAVVGWVAWFAVLAVFRPTIDAELVLPVAGLAGAAAVIVSLLVELAGIRSRRVVVFIAVWSLLGFAPVAIALFSEAEGLLGGMLGTLDLGGALPALVATGAAGAAVLLVERRRAPLDSAPSARSSLVLGCFAVVWILWIVWLVGFELAIDALTAPIVVNALVAPVAAMICWLIVQRIRHARTSATAAAGGLLSGLVAITAGCAYLNTVGAVITGAIAGAACSLAAYAAERRSGRSAWLLVVVLLVGAGIGVVLLGVFATRAGLMFTGQPEVLFAQAASVAGVVIYSATIAFVVWTAVRMPAASRARSAQPRDLG